VINVILEPIKDTFEWMPKIYNPILNTMKYIGMFNKSKPISKIEIYLLDKGK
jgi:hypothetical protein